MQKTLAFDNYGVILNYNTILLSQQSKANDMLKLRRNIRPRIPNALAAVAAMTLAATSLLGSSGSMDSCGTQADLAESQRAAPVSWVARDTTVEEAPVSQTKRKAGFRVNLFLFRHH